MSDEHNERMLAENSQEKPKKTRSVTFRVDSAVVDELQREADGKEVSLNVLVNQVLKRYSDWGKYEKQTWHNACTKSNVIIIDGKSSECCRGEWNKRYRTL